MKNLIFKKHDSGFATIASVIMVSILLVTSLTSIYVYQMNNIRFQKRIKETHKLIGVMEEAAKIVRGAWDRAAADPTVNPNDSAQVGAKAQDNLNQITATTQDKLCIKNPDRPATAPAACTCAGGGAPFTPPDYCFGVPVNMNAYNWELKMEHHESPIEGSRFERFVAKLDQFFDSESMGDFKQTKDSGIFLKPPTVVGWLFAESKAIAQDYHNPTQTDPQTVLCPGSCPTNCMSHPVCVNRSTLRLPATNCESGDANAHHASCQECGTGYGAPCLSLTSDEDMFGGKQVAQKYLIVPAGRLE
jgi:hypothetical protein